MDVLLQENWIYRLGEKYKIWPRNTATVSVEGHTCVAAKETGTHIIKFMSRHV